MAAKKKKRSLGRRLDQALFGIPADRRKLGFRNPAAKRRKLYQAGYVAGMQARKNPGQFGELGTGRDGRLVDSLVSVERTVLFREAASGDPASAREFFLAGFSDGAGERSNPKAQSAFARCVKEVAGKGGAARGNRAALADSSNAEVRLRVASKSRGRGWSAFSSWTYYDSLPELNGYLHDLHEQANLRGTSYKWEVGRKENNGSWSRHDSDKGSIKPAARVLGNPRIGKRNPLDTAEAAYEGFHGKPAEHTFKFRDRRHVHDVVWAFGPLVYLKVWLPSDRRKPGFRNCVDVEFDYEGKKPVLVTANEKRNQMFFDGGDQSVSLATFGVPKEPHETVVLGEVSDAWYFTTKTHLGKDGGTAIYKHKLGEEGGELPTLIYHVLEKRLSLAGGSYTIPNEGVRN